MCPDNETLSAMFDNEIESKFRFKIENHLESCESCRKVISDMEDCSKMFKYKDSDLENIRERVWDRIQQQLDRKEVPDIWHRKITVPLPVLAAASFLVFIVSGLMFSLLFNNYNGIYDGFTVSEAVTVGAEDRYRFLDNEQSVNVELQLPDDAVFMISGTPQLIREVDYLHAYK